MTPAEHLDKIRRLGITRRNYQAKLTAADADLQQAIRAAFTDGLTAKPIAEAAQLSPERIYQLRNGRY